MEENKNEKKVEVKEEKKQTIAEQNNTKPKKEKKKKTIIIASIIMLVILLAAVGGWFAYKYIENNKSVGTEWGDIYHAYLVDIKTKQPSERQANYGFPEQGENIGVEFAQIEENKDPSMVLTYTKEGKDYMNIYYINDDKSVSYTEYNTQPTKIEVMYNIPSEQYGWYLVSTDGDKETYKSLEDEKEYTFTKEEMTTSLDGISKFDETFIDANAAKNTKLILNLDFNDKLFRNTIKGIVDTYKDKNQMITEEVKQYIKTKLEQTESIRENIKNQEEAKKKAEEEAKKKAEEEAKKAAEEAKKTLKVGSYTLKYGTYKGTDYEYTDNADGAIDVTIVLNSDGSYTLTRVKKSTGEKKNSSGTFSTTMLSGMGEYYDGKGALKLSNDATYMVNANNSFEGMAGAGSTFKYQGN